MKANLTATEKMDEALISLRLKLEEVSDQLVLSDMAEDAEELSDVYSANWDRINEIHRALQAFDRVDSNYRQQSLNDQKECDREQQLAQKDEEIRRLKAELAAKS